MIRRLREHEDVLLYGNALNINEQDEAAVVSYLDNEYRKESLNYPLEIPAFDSGSAVWAARHVYISAQLLLFRDTKPSNLPELLPALSIPAEKSVAAILSADLTLRFLPSMITQLKLIDAEDELISILESTLRQWHYSGIAHDQDPSTLDFSLIVSDNCLRTLYCDRIIENRRLALASHPALEKYIRASMGVYGSQLWKDFTPAIHE